MACYNFKKEYDEKIQSFFRDNSILQFAIFFENQRLEGTIITIYANSASEKKLDWGLPYLLLRRFTHFI